MSVACPVCGCLKVGGGGDMFHCYECNSRWRRGRYVE